MLCSQYINNQFRFSSTKENVMHNTRLKNLVFSISVIAFFFPFECSAQLNFMANEYSCEIIPVAVKYISSSPSQSFIKFHTATYQVRKFNNLSEIELDDEIEIKCSKPNRVIKIKTSNGLLQPGAGGYAIDRYSIYLKRTVREIERSGVEFRNSLRHLILTLDRWLLTQSFRYYHPSELMENMSNMAYKPFRLLSDKDVIELDITMGATFLIPEKDSFSSFYVTGYTKLFDKRIELFHINNHKEKPIFEWRESINTESINQRVSLEPVKYENFIEISNYFDYSESNIIIRAIIFVVQIIIFWISIIIALIVHIFSWLIL